MRTGESTAQLRLPFTTDLLALRSVQVGERFELRGVALARGEAPQLSVTVVDREDEDAVQPLVQGRWQVRGATVLSATDRYTPTLTGWQRAYSAALGRELAWGCAMVAAGATPAGVQQADATSDEAPPPVPARPQPAAEGGTVRLAWMGDVMLADGPGRVIARGGDPFAGVAADLGQADLRIANLECVIARGGKQLHKPWTFRAHPRTLAVLRKHVDVVSLANNHSGDYGPQAFGEMLARLDRAGLPYFGGGANLRAAHQPRIVERNGVRIAFLGYDEMFPRRFEATPDTPGIAWADDQQIVADIQAARAQADVVIPYMHWGQEHSAQSHARQHALARLMIRAGADAVVGTHPHVRQDSEVIDGKPVVYSLGNFVFDGFSDADNNTGSILWMTVGAGGVQSWRLQAVGIDKQGLPRPLGDATAQAAGAR